MHSSRAPPSLPPAHPHLTNPPPPSLARSLKGYERERWALQSWQDVFTGLVQGQLQNLFLSTAHHLLLTAQLAPAAGGPAGAAGRGAAGAVPGPGSGITSAANTVESAAPFAALSR